MGLRARLQATRHLKDDLTWFNLFNLKDLKVLQVVTFVGQFGVGDFSEAALCVAGDLGLAMLQENETNQANSQIEI